MGKQGGEYQTPSREKTLATEILRICATSNGNMVVFLRRKKSLLSEGFLWDDNNTVRTEDKMPEPHKLVPRNLVCFSSFTMLDHVKMYLKFLVIYDKFLCSICSLNQLSSHITINHNYRYFTLKPFFVSTVMSLLQSQKCNHQVL